jgi:DNA adenine methylase
MNIIKAPSKHYSPLRYPGGKAGLSDYINNLITKNEIGNCTYLEPFAGGSGAALNLLFNEHVDSIIINDYDKAIYSFWYAVLNETQRFIDAIEKIDLTVREWRNQKGIYHGNTTNLFERGFAAFYLNRTNRSGILTGGPIGGIEQEGRWKIDARFNKDGLMRRISEIGMYRNRIKILNMDGIYLLKDLKHDKSIFIYLDPPYVNKASTLYFNHYKIEDHQALADYLNKKIKLNWLLSYDNVEIIKQLYSKRRQIEFNLNYHADKAKQAKELLIFSDNICDK